MSFFLCSPVGDNSSDQFTPRNSPSVGCGMVGGSWICLERWEVEKVLASVARPTAATGCDVIENRTVQNRKKKKEEVH